MLGVDDARRRILAAASPLDGERIPLAAALGRVLADPVVVATHDVPPFANSAMDGYAVRLHGLPGELRIIGESRAGSAELPAVAPGTAVRIMTGAPMPPAAEAVVPIEQAREAEGRVRIDQRPAAAAHVRAAGHDTRAGEPVRLAGALTPAAVALLASLGIGEVAVHRRPRVAILSTGDELVAPGSPLGAGQIHDANGVALAAAVAEAGGAPLLLEPAPDDEEVIVGRLREAAVAADLVLTSGGVSVGSHDHVRTAIERLGSLDFWRIAVQPGKPLAFGSVDGRPLLGLPGNPVSALVTFELFVRPMLRAHQGLDGDGRLHVRAVATDEIDKDARRESYLRVVVTRDRDESLVARTAGGQQSSQLRPLAEGNGLLVVPVGEPRTVPGRTYETILTGTLA